ncbi:hypothetical protein [Bradyrhizobium elkanii]|uniref:hypothetical protein n=1 Tax=Bradyrhizobium elkanii TaxID=29448 RepID=UPI0021699232|nr:hypothetical protein [Bradyrhizobium elkanii]MCS3690886.1 hypothetical protein [Bradyrhizobium elkanii]
MKSTPEMRARIRELMTNPQDDYDRAVECVLDDLDELIAGHHSISERTDEGVDYKALAIELSDALLTVRPLGGSELLIKRGDRYYADPAYLKLTIERDRDRQHEWIKEAVRAKKDCAKAEAKLAELQRLASAAVQEYPVASGVYVDTDGQDGYGSLKALRLWLGIEPAGARMLAPVSGSTEGGK